MRTMVMQIAISTTTINNVTIFLPNTYCDATKIGLLQVTEDHIQKCTVVVGEII